MLSHARVLCNNSDALRERALLQALDARFLQRSLACSKRPLSRCITTASVARSLILESAQHELEHLAFIARVCATLSLLLSFSAGSFSFSAGSQRLSQRLFFCTSLSAALSASASLSLRLRLSRSATRLDLRVCHHLSLRLSLSLSSYWPRLQ